MWVVCPELRIEALNQQDTVSVEIIHRLDLLQVDLRSFLASGASFLGQASDEVAGGFESLPIAPCTEIRIADSGKFLLVEFGIQPFGILKYRSGIRNPLNDWKIRTLSSTHKD